VRRAALVAGAVLVAACGGEGERQGQGDAAAVVEDGGMSVSDTWVRPTAPGVTSAAIYLVVENVDAPADRILGASADRCSAVVPHQTVVDDDGVASMPGILGDELDLPPGAVVTMEPLGLHLMCLGIGEPIALGDDMELTLTFDVRDPMTVPVAVANR
jgi:periplasmic copper chaperone A